MARMPRLDAPGAVHHVMARGIERRNIFLDDADRRDFVARLEKILLEEGWLCFIWVLLHNHYHLVVQSLGGRLSRLMARLNTGYARSFNLRYERVGYLFQNRFRSRLVRNDADLMGLVLYVSRNPLRAGLVRTLDELEDYPWCGVGALTGRRPALPFESNRRCLELFGSDVADARRCLRRKLAEEQEAPGPNAPAGTNGEATLDAGNAARPEDAAALESTAHAEVDTSARRPAPPPPSASSPRGAAPGVRAIQETLIPLTAAPPVQAVPARTAQIRLPVDPRADAAELIRRLMDEVAHGVGVAIHSDRPRLSRAQAEYTRSITAAIAADQLCHSRAAIADAFGITPSAVSHAARRGRSLLLQLGLCTQPDTPPSPNPPFER